MDNDWDFVLSEFRSLGGIAENVCQKEGEFGRGIFSINPKKRSRIYTPSNLMIKKEDICLENNHLRIKKDRKYSNKIRDFFNCYQDNFSWGCGGKETTESFERGLSFFSPNLKKILKDYMLFDIDTRHAGSWDSVVKNQFLNSRVVAFRQDQVIAPFWELLNHEVNALPFFIRFDGVSTPNYPPRISELTHVYGYSSSINRVFNHGFFCQEPVIFSLPFNINIKNSNINLICKGLDLFEDQINYKSTDSKIIIDGIPIAAIKGQSFIKNYFDNLLELINLKHISQDIFSKIVSLNYLKRKEVLGELQSSNNYSSRIISKAINYELDSISHV